MLNRENSLIREDHNKLLIAAIVVALAVVAGLPRFWNLGELGFFGDEETTSLPSLALAVDGDAVMPSGMPYNRAISQTWANAQSAKLFGLSSEFSYRLPSAVSGTLTVVAVFLLLTPFCGKYVAAVAAVLLALSEWNIILSRTARMYGPFLLCFLTCALSTWLWATSRKPAYFVLSAVSFVGAATLHALSVLCAIIPLLLLAFPDKNKVRQHWLLILSGAMGGAAWATARYLHNVPFRTWPVSDGRTRVPVSGESAGDELAQSLFEIVGLQGVAWLFLIAGLAIGLYVLNTLNLYRPDRPAYRWRSIALSLLIIGACIGACLAYLHASFILVLLFLIMYPDSKIELLKKTWPAIAAVALIAAVHTIVLATDLSTWDLAKRIIGHPYPTILVFAEAMPVLVTLFLASVVILALSDYEDSSAPARLFCIAAILPLFAVGLFGGAPIRYLTTVYPFIVLTPVAVAIPLIQRFLDPMTSNARRLSLAALGIVSIVGVPSHSVYAAIGSATITYGDNRASMQLPFYPDHKNPGLFVKQMMRDEDVVIAEDALQQAWYVGDVDYWFRSPRIEARFHYIDPNDGRQKDIYVSSEILSAGDIEAVLNAAGGRVFYITSGELVGKEQWYLDEDQSDWLTKLRELRTPLMIGQDGQTAVYCLNCDARLD
ncbi:MAG: glycosyltransferase family 39 protein [Woeseiaceae bacterium]|nr:glycosyltransferase family 39 protein [Woeseiaceae bacterium]